MAAFHHFRHSVSSPALKLSHFVHQTSGAFVGRGMAGMMKAFKLGTNLSSLDSPFMFHRMNVRALRAQKRSYSQVSSVKAKLQIELVPCLVDNYAYIIYDPKSNETGVIDPSAAEPIKKALSKKGRQLTYVLNTHHHWDHTGGNKDLKYHYGAKIVAPHADGIQEVDVPIGDGDTWMFGEHVMNILGTPGHTRGHVSFYFPGSKAVFTGDTLFSIGCGRLFEGSADQMWTSLSKISNLPNDTMVYCGHEYTLSNAKFALTMEPNNKELLSYVEKIKMLRDKGLPTIPSLLEVEKQINPFLRPFSVEIKKTLNLPMSSSNVQVFAATRGAKDRS